MNVDANIKTNSYIILMSSHLWKVSLVKQCIESNFLRIIFSPTLSMQEKEVFFLNDT